MVNNALVKRVYTEIKAHPELFNMQTFRSENGRYGVSYCFAGWVLALSGYTWTWQDNCRLLHGPGGGRCDNPAKAARQLLGLTASEANRLFYAYGIKDPQDLRMELILLLGMDWLK